MAAHRFARTLERLLEIEAPLLRFFTDSAAAHMDRDADLDEMVERAIPVFEAAARR